MILTYTVLKKQLFFFQDEDHLISISKNKMEMHDSLKGKETTKWEN